MKAVKLEQNVTEINVDYTEVTNTKSVAITAVLSTKKMIMCRWFRVFKGNNIIMKFSSNHTAHIASLKNVLGVPWPGPVSRSTRG